MTFYPSFNQLETDLQAALAEGANLVPISLELPQGDNSPVDAFLKVRRGKYSFLLESSTEENATVALHSIIGTEPWKVVTCGEGTSLPGDPLNHISTEFKNFRVFSKYAIHKPALLSGGAVGYVSYDCVRYFEPRAVPVGVADVLSIPEALFIYCGTFLLFSHSQKTLRVVSLCTLTGDVKKNYDLAILRINEILDRLKSAAIPFEDNHSIESQKGISNAGYEGYCGFVRKLKERIVDGDIIQAVPSHRIARKTGVHPFHIYTELRQLNPSRYMFFLELDRFFVVGSSPELLAKVDEGRVITHPIAGTRRRGKTAEEDEKLARELLADEKERAEHIMLVDLGRNDVNRVCVPHTVKVDSLMAIEKHSHVMHIVSQVSGQLRSADCSSLDAFRAIFPAGTVSGAPKIKAMELISSLEKGKRGIYAGAVGYFSFVEDLDTCIAIRTLLCKDDTVYLQAGGGIVFDSNEDDEYQETVNKMAALEAAVNLAEKKMRSAAASSSSSSSHSKVNPAPHSDISIAHEQSLRALNTPITPKRSIPTAVSSDSPQQTQRTTLLIDNYDSFTYNLYQYLSQLGARVIVHRNDRITLQQCIDLRPDNVVISPGPGWPKEAGVSNLVIPYFQGKVPVLGVCLGHECMTELYGGKIVHCGEIKHGKTSKILHDGKGVYKGLPNDIDVIRYHSLAAAVGSLSDDVEVTSRTHNGIIMGLRHRKYTVEGVQFHPESILTVHGLKMLENFLALRSGQWDTEK